MSKKVFVLKALYLVIVAIILFAAFLFFCEPTNGTMPEEQNLFPAVTRRIMPKIPTEEDLKEVETAFQTVNNFLVDTSTLQAEIEELYEQEQGGIVSSITNRYFNQLHEKYLEFEETLTSIETQISICEAEYNEYLELLNAIPSYRFHTKKERETEFKEKIEPLYQELCIVKQTYRDAQAHIEEIHAQGQELADSIFNLEYPVMCQIVNAEGGSPNYPSIDRYYIMDVLVHRQLSPYFEQTSLIDVVFAPGQYSPTWNGSYYATPSEVTKRDVEYYMRGHVVTDMPMDVVYQAKFKQGSGVWKYMESTTKHYFCYH